MFRTIGVFALLALSSLADRLMLEDLSFWLLDRAEALS